MGINLYIRFIVLLPKAGSCKNVAVGFCEQK